MVSSGDDSGQTSKQATRKSLLDSLHSLIDSNLRLVKNSVYIVGGVGLILVARSIHATRVFRHVEDIPERFIRSQVRLLGRVKEVREDGSLAVQHIPSIRLPFVRHTKDCPLPVYLACIDVSPRGRVWLEENAGDQTIWFHLLHRTSDVKPPRLYSRVEIPKTLRTIQVNEELIKLGLCKISSLSSFHQDPDIGVPTDKNLLLYLDRLIHLENTASSRGVGMWTETQSEDRWKWARTSYQVVKTVVTAPVTMVRWGVRKWQRRKT